MTRIALYTFAALIGAVAAWAIMEPTALMPEGAPGVEPVIPYGYLVVIGLVTGLLIGLFLGVAEGLAGLSPKGTMNCAMSGALVGAAGGMLGLTFGNVFYNAMYRLSGGVPSVGLPGNLPPEAQIPTTPPAVAFVLLLIGRSFGWALIGGFIGLSPGIATGSTQKMTNGAIGGLVGGGIGGCVFEILAWMNRGGVTNFPPGMVRFISFAITGAAIGLFIGFVEEVTKKAWLKRLVGRNEGKEYTIFKPVTLIGRDETAEVPVFGDPDVSERHARITAQGRWHIIEDLGSFFGTTVNGKKIAKETLHDGDIIEIGKARFLFRDKATAKYRPDDSGYLPSASIPQSKHVCPFCGAVRDAAGNCDCTVGAAPAGTTVQETAQMPSTPTVVSPRQPGPTTPVDPGQAEQGARLTAVGGPYNGSMFVLRPATRIGRDSTMDVSLSQDNTVSRSHSRIALEGATWVLYDDGSTNGTYVNGARLGVEGRPLAPGDVVQVGSTKFRFSA